MAQHARIFKYQEFKPDPEKVRKLLDEPRSRVVGKAHHDLVKAIIANPSSTRENCSNLPLNEQLILINDYLESNCDELRELEAKDSKAHQRVQLYYYRCIHQILLEQNPNSQEDFTGPYDRLSATLDAEQHAFRQQLAAKLAPALNARAREMPHGTYEEKKELARWVNEELRRFDLAIKCPKTGEPSMVMATPGNSPESGRFSIEHKTAEGKRVRSVNTIELPEFELMEAAPRREALREWQDRVKRGDSGASRA